MTRIHTANRQSKTTNSEIFLKGAQGGFCNICLVYSPASSSNSEHSFQTEELEDNKLALFSITPLDLLDDEEPSLGAKDYGLLFYALKFSH